MDELTRKLSQARILLRRKDYRDCHALCLNVLQSQPDNADAFLILGQLTADHQNFSKALELFERAIRSGEVTGEAEAHSARCLIALNRRDEAVVKARAAANRKPKDALVLDTIGVVLSRAGHHEDALEYYQAAVAANPDEASYHYNLGAALQFLGQFDPAKSAFRACLERNPDDSRALVALASMGDASDEDSLIPKLEAAWDARDQEDADQALQLAHALARAYEDQQDPATAMDWLERGKRQKRARTRNREEDDKACFATAAALAAQLTIVDPPAAGGPIFIVGMPRTGTTLTDRILSSHPEVTSAGELSDFSVALKRQTQTSGPYVLDPETLDAARNTDLARLGQTYLDKVSATLGLEGRFVDKMPLNAFFAPVILSAIPNARVVCLRRHAADTVLSNFRQLFATSFSYYAYAYDLKATARYVVQFFNLIDEYETALPASRFKILDYESLVADQEGQTRQLLAFCGLEFDPACLNFHENAAPVATASATQVRQPLYSSSMGRWKSYRPAMDPALEILQVADLI
ncbi:MAG: sulfotransferase [Hyphomonadaceae bacterium]|nr:sulfotransferase [Hyphomonadaceae bacterium]